MNNQTAKALTAALQALSPSILSLQNESHMHAGYFEGKESHFKLVIVSDAFEKQRLAARHQTVYALAQLFLTVNGGMVHALHHHSSVYGGVIRLCHHGQYHTTVCQSQYLSQL